MANIFYRTYIVLVFSTLFVSCAAAQPMKNEGAVPQSNVFRFNERNAVKMNIPETWKVQINGEETESGVGYTLIINTGNDVRFMGFITILAANKPNEMTREYFFALIQDEGDTLASQSVEGQAVIVPIDVNNGYGAYYILTDADLVGKTPGPDEYKVLARIVIQYDNGALASITAVMDDSGCDEFTQFMASIVTMELVP